MDDELTLNIEAMDTRHDEFLVLLDEIKSAKDSEFLELFSNMIAHTKEHFAFEEEIMNKHNFYDKAEHFGEHENLLNEMHYFYEKAKKMKMFGRSYINDYAYEKFKRHVTNVDSQLAMFIKEKNITL